MTSLLAVFLAGCRGPAEPPGNSGDTGDTGTTGDSGLEAPRFTVSGQVLDVDGGPVVDVFVTVSTEFCIPDRTDAEGRFQVADVDPGEKRLITYGETAGNGLFASVVVRFEADAAWTLDAPLTTPALTQRWPIDPASPDDQHFTSAEGFEIDIPAGSLTLAPFAPAELQLAREPLPLAPDFVPAGFELVDLFVLHPIQSTLDPPAPVRFPADTGLAPGTPVRFLALDYDTGMLTPVATGTVDDDGTAATAPGQGIPELTWIGLALENP
ncbi:MAG: carboxypeptidase regulatory-like domain-containing protein [Deltaproteobacteria bacterium]|nr:MAG: carboxypeptidase regulatory-like domain-containing protein [Deltaproteobacteria bacterium]